MNNKYRDINRERKYRPVARNAIATIVFVLMLFFSAHIDLFGIKSAGATISTNLFQRVFSSVNYDARSQSFSSVFLFNDAYLGKRKLHWPLDYDTQLKIFSEILSQKPKAVFLDFLYKNAHGNTEEVNEFVESLTAVAKTHGVPVVIPMLMENPGYDCSTDYSVEPEVHLDSSSLLPSFTHADFKKSYTKWVNCENLYPLFLSANTRYSSPAFRLYRLFCDQNTGGCLKYNQESDSNLDWLERFKQPMDIQWGVNLSKDSYQLLSELGTTCQPPATGFWARFGYSLKQIKTLLIQVVLGDSNRGFRAKCPYSDTFYAHFLVDTPGGVDNFFKAMIKDRYVFVGANTETNRHWVANPVNGKVAGVYLHAMAFDNLVSQGADYIRPMSKAYSALCEIVVFIIIVALVKTLSGLLLRYQSRHPFSEDITVNRYHSMVAVGSVLIINGLVPLLMVLAAASLCLYYGYTPLDWIGVMAAADATEAFAKREQIKRFLFKPLTDVECTT